MAARFKGNIEVSPPGFISGHGQCIDFRMGQAHSLVVAFADNLSVADDDAPYQRIRSCAACRFLGQGEGSLHVLGVMKRKHILLPSHAVPRNSLFLSSSAINKINTLYSGCFVRDTPIQLQDVHHCHLFSNSGLFSSRLLLSASYFQRICQSYNRHAGFTAGMEFHLSPEDTYFSRIIHIIRQQGKSQRRRLWSQVPLKILYCPYEKLIRTVLLYGNMYEDIRKHMKTIY
jgi:hypothetical protein